jgi:cytochrome b pre-mRNA-processing protein 3
MLQRLLSRRRERALLKEIYGGVLAAARSPALFGAGGFADDMDGRFECLAAHAAVAAGALKARGEADLARRFVELMFDDLDAALRETGVGDHSIARRMRKLGEAFTGRALAYGAALAAGDRAGLQAALARNIGDSHGLEPERVRALAGRLADLRTRLDREEVRDWTHALSDFAAKARNS